ncbi:hypothetical protein PIB30_051253 [Stylosanthes scabra]|uniref:Heparanase-like protein 2 n=1 Tax=Stylosanthes scabra TaxID=79078 RepID=A0ABU6ZGL5_9FABA|nr:hypothetical protein [Stylosanthes scabra]
MGLFHLALFLYLVSPLSFVLSQDVEHGSVNVDGAQSIADTDENFICATIDWWPQDKCDYNNCPWGNTSIVNLDLSQPLLAKAIQGLKPLRIRIGGSLQDQVLYEVGYLKSPCQPFKKKNGGLFGFSNGCLQMERWDEINQFFNKTGAILTFGLNALNGRHKTKHSTWVGDWDPTNAHDLINYTISKGYNIDSWEFGNELSGKGIGANVGPIQYGKDLIKLKQIVNTMYDNHNFKPSLIAPGGFYDKDWFDKLLQVTGSGVVNALTHHIYNLGPGSDVNLDSKILDPDRLSKVESVFSNMSETVKKYGPWSNAWVGEAGGAYNSGGLGISDTFVNSFCALLWNQLMGKKVLSASSDVFSPFLRTYAHCSKGRDGVTFLLINLSNKTHFLLTIHDREAKEDDGAKHILKENSFSSHIKSAFSWVGTKASDVTFREEYHLTPKDGYLRSQTMLLNGNPLELTHAGEIPSLDPVKSDVHSPLHIAPLSIVFIVYPNFDAPACALEHKKTLF